MKTFTQHIFEIELSDFDKELQDPDIKAGFDAYINSIKNGGRSNANPGSSGDKSGNDENGNPKDDDMGDASGEQAMSNGGGSGQGGQQGQGQSGSDGDQQGSGGGSRSADPNDEDCGVVTASDMGASGCSSVKDCPQTAGGMISREDGQKLTEMEGYPKESDSTSQIEKTWKDRAMKTADELNKRAGNSPGSSKLVSKIYDIHKTNTDWKKALRNIVGRCISPMDKRRAYANKNILVTQNRIARTDKDKYDALDYIICAVDTSGSMTEDYLNQCITECYQVATQKKPMNIVVIQWDTVIQDVQIFRNINELKKSLGHFKLKGRGGTNPKCIWEFLKTDPKFKGTQSELIMIFTDGDIFGGQPKRDPKLMQNLVWVICGDPAWKLEHKDAGTFVIHLPKDPTGKKR